MNDNERGEDAMLNEARIFRRSVDPPEPAMATLGVSLRGVPAVGPAVVPTSIAAPQGHAIGVHAPVARSAVPAARSGASTAIPLRGSHLRDPFCRTMESHSPSSVAGASPNSSESAGTTCLPSPRNGDCSPQRKTEESRKTEDIPLMSPKYVELSKGSRSHPDACKPCAWFWHHKGCQSGVDCEFCHLCPRGELKARQARQKELKTVPRGESKAWDEVPCETEQSKETWQDFSPLPSVGSAAHSTGECRPCAWFWKEGGCKNGKDCRHCHLCPEGEIRHRKKLKQEGMKAMLRSQGNASSALHPDLLQMQLFHQWQAHMFAANMIQSSMESLSLDGYPS
eukprot:s2093_g6.t1